MNRQEERAIVGGGIGGLSLALALIDRGALPETLTVIDGRDRRRGSDAPATMLHAFPGRSMKFRPGQADAFVRSWKRMERWRELLGESWWRAGPMLRPLSDDERGERLRRSWKKAREGYPPLISGREMSAEEAAKEFVGLTPSGPVVVYGPAAGVMLPELVERLQRELEQRGVRFIFDKMVELQPKEKGWEIGLANQKRWTGSEVVLAIGASLDRYFPQLDMRRRAGEVILLDPGGQRLPCLINGESHLFERPDGLWGMGSTYFPPREWEDRDDDEIAARLQHGLIDLVPHIREAKVVGVWRGERGMFGSDDMPLVGPIPGQQGLYAFGSFGSKGLIWAPSAAEDLAALIDGERDAIPKSIDIRRISARKFQDLRLPG